MFAQTPQSATEIASGFEHLALDPQQTYHVRELRLARGDIKIYLSEGILSFATQIDARTYAAVFTTEGVEAGDAEVLVLPPQRSERASLVSFAKTPNLDEHFSAALFVFSDDTAKELLAQIGESPVRKATENAPQIAPIYNPVLRDVASQIEVRLIQAVLDHHAAEQGFFYGLIAGRQLGAFDVTYEPADFEPVSVGHVAATADGQQAFQLWTSFRPRHAPVFVRAPSGISDYQVDATVHRDLSMSVTAAFNVLPGADAGRVLPFALSDRLKVDWASIDGHRVEIFQRGSVRLAELKSPETFLLVSDEVLTPGRSRHVEIHYEGSVIRQTSDGSYLVDERNAWYPYRNPMSTNFDLTFHCPADLRLVSTGELVSDEVANGIRTVHRKTRVPESLAGFNLGNYDLTSQEKGLYRVECYANKVISHELDESLDEISKATERILDFYTQRWIQLPARSVAVSPVPGYFGQGFPGLIYLSTVSYLRREDRPIEFQNPRMDTFFSELLLPHEVAHQWWGNIVGAANYRSGWLIEAMANYSALEFLEKTEGAGAMHAVLSRYRDDLTREEHGKTVESTGPVDFGLRLLETAGASAWHAVVYEKGTWILHMLRERLGEENFNKMQLRMLHEYASKPISNEDFRQIASDFAPPGEPDKTLALFFDTWVYGTGIPRMRMERAGKSTTVTVSGVDDDFTADVPFSCKSRDGREHVEWLRISGGSNNLEASGCEMPALNAFLYSPAP